MKKLAVIVALVVSSGCANVRYATKAEPAAESTTKWNHFFLWGILPTAEVELYEMCPQGVARVEVKHSFLTMLVSLITIGLYNPTSTEVWCAKAAAPAAPKPEGSTL